MKASDCRPASPVGSNESSASQGPSQQLEELSLQVRETAGNIGLKLKTMRTNQIAQFPPRPLAPKSDLHPNVTCQTSRHVRPAVSHFRQVKANKQKKKGTGNKVNHRREIHCSPAMAIVHLISQIWKDWPGELPGACIGEGGHLSRRPNGKEWHEYGPNAKFRSAPISRSVRAKLLRDQRGFRVGVDGGLA